MSRRIIPGLVVMMFVFVQAGQAQNNVRKHFSEIASQVKATEDPVQKREILTQSFESITAALARAQDSPLVSKDDRVGLARLNATVREHWAELAGLNGYEPVPDAQLNDFADYSLQAIEQAAQRVTISLVAALLILIAAILIVS